MDLKELVTQKLTGNFPEISFDITDYKNQIAISFDKQHIATVSDFLKNEEDLQFKLCEDITAVDWARRANRFTVVYHIFSFKLKSRVRLKVGVDSDEAVDTVSSIWKTANWHERETYDMYGINFKNHPDLRRMYMPEEFEYHPLRKDFPLMGIPGSLPLPKKEN